MQPRRFIQVTRRFRSGKVFISCTDATPGPDAPSLPSWSWTHRAGADALPPSGISWLPTRTCCIEGPLDLLTSTADRPGGKNVNVPIAVKRKNTQQELAAPTGEKHNLFAYLDFRKPRVSIYDNDRIRHFGGVLNPMIRETTVVEVELRLGLSHLLARKSWQHSLHFRLAAGRRGASIRPVLLVTGMGEDDEYFFLQP